MYSKFLQLQKLTQIYIPGIRNAAEYTGIIPHCLTIKSHQAEMYSIIKRISWNKKAQKPTHEDIVKLFYAVTKVTILYLSLSLFLQTLSSDSGWLELLIYRTTSRKKTNKFRQKSRFHSEPKTRLERNNSFSNATSSAILRFVRHTNDKY